jgi:hypothetical protein
MDVRFETWNVGSVYRTGSLKSVASKLAKHKLELVAVQGGMKVVVSQQMIIHFYSNGNTNNHLGMGFSYIMDSNLLLRG